MLTDNTTAEFKSGYFADLCRERGIPQEFTTANSPQFNGVTERGTAMIVSTGKAASIQLTVCSVVLALRSVIPCGRRKPIGPVMLLI